MNVNNHEPRADVIRRHVNNYFRIEKAATEEGFADDVKCIYHDVVCDAADRVVQFHEGGDVSKILAANAQLLFRMLKGRVKFLADLEEPVVMALPEPYQSDCKTELAARYDMLPVYASNIRPERSVNNVSRLLRETSDVVDALAPMLADGVIDEKDRPLAKRGLKEIQEAMAVLVELNGQILKILPDDGEAVLRVVGS